MPKVKLTRVEVETGDLPPVCVVCGDAGGVYIRKMLYCFPRRYLLGFPLIFLLPYLLPVLLLLPHARILVPFCWQHCWHWTWRNAIIYGWLLASYLLWLSAICLSFISSESRNSGSPVEDLISLLMTGGCVGLLSWPIVALTLKYTGVHASWITPKSVTLCGLSSRFVERLEVHRHERPDSVASVAEKSGNLNELSHRSH